jgi:large subunit ribosomal protein L6
MSNIGKKIITIPEGVDVSLSKNMINVKGKLGDLSIDIDKKIKVNIDNNILSVTRKSDHRKSRELHGLYRALINNMITGVSEGFKKELNFVGVGYTVEKKGEFLQINAGYSHPVFFQIPSSIEVEIPNNTTLIIKGFNKQNVGDISAKIRQIRKPEPYKGKGVKFVGEYVRRKVGKTAAAA